VTFGGIALAFIVVYKFVLPSSAKRELASEVAETAIGQNVMPWPDRADAAVKKQLSGQSGANVAASIQRIAHPTGNGGTIDSVTVRRMGDRLSVRIDVSWQGGFLGSKNTTTVIWEFDQSRHISATLMGDTGAFGVGSSNAKKLDQYFASEVYPTLRTNTGE
jgi:hypothetical protein